MVRTTFILCLTLAAFLTGCGESEEAAFSTSLSITNASGTEETAFTSGQEATITLTVRNLSSVLAVLETPSYASEVFILNSSGGVVWSSIYNASIPAVVTYKTFWPWEAKNYVSQWDLADSFGNSVTPDQYYVQGYFGVLDEIIKQSSNNYTESDFRSQMVTLTVY